MRGTGYGTDHGAVAIAKGMEFADILVPTIDTVRTSFILEQVMLPITRTHHCASL